MVKPDVIVCNPYSIEYPLWRSVMEKYKDKFGKVILGYYQDFRRYDFRDFIQSSMPDAIHVDCGIVPGDVDWRNHSINPCLEKSDSEWVLFIEQDFLAEESFWDEVLEEVEEYDIAGYADKERTTSLQGDLGDWSASVRLHPAFILVKRKFIEQTSKDFGAHPDKNRDHFGTFTEELFAFNLKFYDLNKRTDWKHWAGVYSNMMLVQAGQNPNYRPEEFIEFCEMSLKVPVDQDSRVVGWLEDCIKVSNECLTKK